MTSSNSLPCPTKAGAFAGTRVPLGLKVWGCGIGEGAAGQRVTRLNSLPCPTKAGAFAGARVPPGLKNPGLHPGFGGGGSEFVVLGIKKSPIRKDEG